MDLRNNTVFGWVLGAGIVALGLTSLTGLYYRAERPEKMGFAIAGVAVAEGAVETPIETLLASADLAAGEASFAKCATCHSINAGGANGIGPNLHGVVGSNIAAHAPGFSYSSALQGVDGNWDFANLNAWLTSPRRFANGTTMSFAGLSDPQERANVLAYLNSQGSNLPLPAAPAAPAAPAEGAAPTDGAAAPADAAAAPATPAAPPAAPAN
jgi:cytochrome c